MEDKNYWDLDEAVKIADEAWSIDIEKDNSKKEHRYKRGGSNRCRKKDKH